MKSTPSRDSLVTRPLGMTIDRFLLARAEAAEEDADALRSLLHGARRRMSEIGIVDDELIGIVEVSTKGAMWDPGQVLARAKVKLAVTELLAATANSVTDHGLRTAHESPVQSREIPMHRVGIALLALMSDILTAPERDSTGGISSEWSAE